MSASVFNIPIDGGSWDEVLSRVNTQTSTWIVTANPENLLTAYEYPEYHQALRAADYRTVDGVGLWLVLRVKGARSVRLTGVDLAEQLIGEAKIRGWRVALFGGDAEVADHAADVWRERFSGLAIKAWGGGRVRDDGSEDGKTWEDREAMLAWRPDVLLCALGGGGMKQERWIHRHREAFLGIRAIVGVGGAFDMWTGRLHRAPRLMRALGLEWLWRWTLQPSRTRRMWRATGRFLFYALSSSRSND